MKNTVLIILLTLILFGITGCANSPVKIANHENSLVGVDTCIFLPEDISKEQVIYSYNSFDDTREPRFLYDLEEYVKLENPCKNTMNSIQLEEIYIDEHYQSFSKFKFYRRFVFDVKAGLFIDGKYYISKYYQTETTTDIITLTQDASISDPLSQGYENILLEIKEDINKIKQNNEKNQQ